MVRFLAHFDGKYLLPQGPVDLPTGTPLQVTAEALPSQPPVVSTGSLSGWLDSLESQAGLMDGPADYAAELDSYLNGAPRSKPHGG